MDLMYGFVKAFLSIVWTLSVLVPVLVVLESIVVTAAVDVDVDAVTSGAAVITTEDVLLRFRLSFTEINGTTGRVVVLLLGDAFRWTIESSCDTAMIVVVTSLLSVGTSTVGSTSGGATVM
jgi:hypothetical protein